jgi:hypothetical protein
MAARARTGALCLLAATLLLPAAPRAEAPAPPLDITITGAKRLRLGKNGYAGKLAVSIRNRGDRPVTFQG